MNDREIEKDSLTTPKRLPENNAANANKNEIVESMLIVDKDYDEKPSQLMKFKKFISKYRGFVYALISSVLFSISHVLIKKANYVSGSDQVIIRNILQLTSMTILAKRAGMNLLGPKEMRKILCLRGLIAAFAFLGMNFSIKMIDPSDAISILHANIISTAIFARIILKEKLSFAHLISTILTIVGIFLISQPTFLFESKHIRQLNKSVGNYSFTNQSNDSTIMIPKSNITLNPAQIQLLGLCLALFVACVTGILPVVLKHLSNKNVHFTIVIIYAAYFGLPVAAVASIILKFAKIDNTFYYLMQDRQLLLIQLVYSIVSGILSLCGQTLGNLAINHEDPSKIQIVRSTDVLFTFLLQHFLLHIDSNLFSVFGAVSITLASIFVISYKIMNNKYDKAKIKKSRLMIEKNNQNNHNHSENEPTLNNLPNKRRSSRLLSIFFLKF